jgi:hypothetical protein
MELENLSCEAAEKVGGWEKGCNVVNVMLLTL